MHVVVVGGTGFIGRALVQELLGAGHRVTVATRGSGGKARRELPPAVEIVTWPGADGSRRSDAENSSQRGAGDPSRRGITDSRGTDASGWLPSGADAVVNLAGAPIARRWTKAAKRLIIHSRVETTRAVVAALAQRTSEGGPRILVNASAVGYYGPRGDEEVTEADTAGNDFLATVCLRWEEAAHEAEAFGVRVVRLRTGFVVGRGGAMRLMTLPYRLFVGGPLGSGRQWLPWVHIDDVVGLIRFCLENPAVRGPINVTAPEPVRHGDFARALGRAMGRPSRLRVPAFAVRAVLGEMADMLLTGQRAVPAAALAAGYSFRRPHLDAALRSVVG